jgi:hypothetical protein
MLQRTVSGYFTVTSKLVFAVSEVNVPNLHYAVHILIWAYPSGRVACGRFLGLRVRGVQRVLPNVVSLCVIVRPRQRGDQGQLRGCQSIKKTLIRWLLGTAVLRSRTKMKSRNVWVFCVVFVFSECCRYSLPTSLAFVLHYILLFPFSLTRLHPTFPRKVCRSVVFTLRLESNTEGSRFATVCFTTIHFYDPFRVGPSTPDCGASLSQLKRPFSA